MHRRQLLHVLAAGGVVAAGCLSEPVATGQTTEPRTRTTTDGGTLSILSVETDTTVLRLNDLGNAPRASIPDRSELDDREREVVTSAIESSYETDEIPDWLTKFANGTRFVRADGEYYRLHSSLPVHTITAEPVSEDEVSGAVASNEEYRDAVTHDGLRMTGLLRIAQEGEGFRTNYVWPSLREFLDDYDAVRYRGELLDLEETIDDPGPPYEITAERASLDEVAGGPVWNATDAPANLREIVREAGTASGTYSLDDPPEGLLENLESHEYVYLDGTFYTTYVENENPHDVAIRAEAVTDTGEDTTRIRLALQNEADGPVEIMSGAPAPFGVVRCHDRDAPDGTHHLLWSDAYEENRHVHTEGRDVVAVNDIGLITELGPGEAISREFEIPSDLVSGEYIVDSGVGVEYADREGGSLSFRVHFRIE